MSFFDMCRDVWIYCIFDLIELKDLFEIEKLPKSVFRFEIPKRRKEEKISKLREQGYKYFTEKESKKTIKTNITLYDSSIMKTIYNPSEELCKLAVQQNEFAIKWIDNPSEDVCKLAVQIYGHAIQYIDNPSEELCKLAVQQNGLRLCD